MSQISDLETVCATCRGAGGYRDIEEDGGFATCDKCGGSGYVPTEDGAKILSLIRHNCNVTLSAALRVCGSPAVSSHPLHADQSPLSAR